MKTTEQWFNEWDIWIHDKPTSLEFIARVQADAQSIVQMRLDEANAKNATLKALLLETRDFHLRYEERRDWLERRDKALGLPPEP